MSDVSQEVERLGPSLTNVIVDGNDLVTTDSSGTIYCISLDSLSSDGEAITTNTTYVGSPGLPGLYDESQNSFSLYSSIENYSFEHQIRMATKHQMSFIGGIKILVGKLGYNPIFPESRPSYQKVISKEALKQFMKHFPSQELRLELIKYLRIIYRVKKFSQISLISE